MVDLIELIFLSSSLLFFKSQAHAGFCAVDDVNVIPFCTNAHAEGHTIHLDASVAVSDITACTCDFKSSWDETVYINVTTKPNGTTFNCLSVVLFNVKSSLAYFNVTCDTTQTAFRAKKDQLFFVTLLNTQIDYGTYCIRLRTASDATTLNGRCFSSRGISAEITTNKPLTKASIANFDMKTSYNTANRYSSTTGKDEEREPISKDLPIEILGAAGCGGAVVIALVVVIIVCYRRKNYEKQKSNDNDNIFDEKHGSNFETEMAESHPDHGRNTDNSTCEISDEGGGGYAAVGSNIYNFKRAIAYYGGGGYADVGSYKYVISNEKGGRGYAAVASNNENVKHAISFERGGGYAEVGSFKDSIGAEGGGYTEVGSFMHVIGYEEGGRYAEVGSKTDNFKNAIRDEGGYAAVVSTNGNLKHAINGEGGGYAEVGSNNAAFIHVMGDEEWGGYAEVGLTKRCSATQASSKYSLSQNQIIQEQEQQDVVPVYAMPDKTKHRNEENNGPVYAMPNKTKKKNNQDDTGPVQAIQNTKNQNVSADETGPVYALPDKKKTKGAEQKKRTAKPAIATKPKLGINEINQA